MQNDICVKVIRLDHYHNYSEEKKTQRASCELMISVISYEKVNYKICSSFCCDK